MAANPQQSTLSGLARALVQAGRIKESEAEVLLSQATATRTTFIEQLIASKKAKSADIARFASDTFGYPLLDLAAFDDAHKIFNHEKNYFKCFCTCCFCNFIRTSKF